jgi:hypothetical protein
MMVNGSLSDLKKGCFQERWVMDLVFIIVIPFLNNFKQPISHYLPDYFAIILFVIGMPNNLNFDFLGILRSFILFTMFRI